MNHPDVSNHRDYFECHVTFMPNSGETIVHNPGWIFSAINGDPVLGQGVKSYLTRQYSSRYPLQHVINETEAVAEALRKSGLVKVLRTKVERVVYDSKTLPQGLIS